MAVGNIYLIAAVAIIGGGLFGFDISSMSAMYVPRVGPPTQPPPPPLPPPCDWGHSADSV
jgi:hypothetical protein